MNTPSIIPNMHPNAGNKALSRNLWKAMWLNWNINKCIVKLSGVLEMFANQYPSRMNAIGATAIHFNLVVGINADDEKDYHQTIEEYFETGIYANNDARHETEPSTSTPNESGQDIRPIGERQESGPVKAISFQAIAPF